MIAGVVYVVDEEVAVTGELRMDGDGMHALLALVGEKRRGQHSVGDIEEQRAIQEPDAAWLFDDEHPAAAVAGMGDLDGLVEPGADLLGADRYLADVERRVVAGRRCGRRQGRG